MGSSGYRRQRRRERNIILPSPPRVLEFSKETDKILFRVLRRTEGIRRAKPFFYSFGGATIAGFLLSFVLEVNVYLVSCYGLIALSFFFAKEWLQYKHEKETTPSSLYGFYAVLESCMQK
ncbi:MAG: hypothetical protein KBC50_01860 [Candidatus Pacebacteria bacterium]|nr:hypothetical protein [Candidatus Paceibacterota bacterium]